MGSRRVSRKRLYNVEKAGISVDLESGAGIKDAVISTSQHRQGQEIITEIAIDLGVTKDSLGNVIALVHGEAPDKPIGIASLSASVAKLTEAKFGIVTEVRAVCVEACTRDIDVVIATNHDVATKGTIGTVTSVLAGGGSALAKGKDGSANPDDSTIRSLYITDGDTAGAGAIGDCKLLIYVHGYVAPDDLV